MKKTISILLAAVMLFALAACGKVAPKEGSAAEAEGAAHYLNALYYNEENALVTVDHYDARGHILGDEVYDNGTLTTYEEFRKSGFGIRRGRKTADPSKRRKPDRRAGGCSVFSQLP